MLHSAIEKTRILAAVSKLLDGAVHLCASFAADRRGSTAIAQALTLGAIALGGSGITSAIGIEINNHFGGLELELCQQVHNFCIFALTLSAMVPSA